jgi:hypothetical protein
MGLRVRKPISSGTRRDGGDAEVLTARATTSEFD